MSEGIKCSNCTYGETFVKRLDEPTNQGCKKPGWEGYTSDETPMCGGDFFIAKELAPQEAAHD